MDPNKTMVGAPVDLNRTMLGTGPGMDPNKTIMGSGPSLNTTVTIKPVQCPVCKNFNPPGVMYCADCGLIFELALDGDAFGAPSIQLPVLVDKNGREFVIRPGDNAIGRNGDIAIEDSRVSRNHAKLVMNDGKITIEDVGSTNGTSVNTVRLAAGQAQALNSGDTVSLGGVELKLNLPGEAAKTMMGSGGRTLAMDNPLIGAEPVVKLVWAAGEHALAPGKFGFGRRSDNDICIPDPFVSGKHGTLEAGEEGVFLTDTGSTNGTSVNDAKLEIGQRTKLVVGDVIKIGELEIRVEAVEA